MMRGNSIVSWVALAKEVTPVLWHQGMGYFWPCLWEGPTSKSRD